jgi:hypothetical protein
MAPSKEKGVPFPWFTIKTFIDFNNRFSTFKMFPAHEDTILLANQ